MSDRQDLQEMPSGHVPPPRARRRPWSSRLLELALWLAISLLTAWILIQNIETILPANNF